MSGNGTRPEGRRNGFEVVMGPAPCSACGAHLYWVRDHRGLGWRDFDEDDMLHRCRRR